MKYEKVIIKEDGSNLPKVEGNYYVHVEEYNDVQLWEYKPFPEDQKEWLKNIDWYLLPEQESTELTDQKIFILFNKYSNCLGKSPIKLPCMTRSAFADAIKEYAQFSNVTDEDIEKEALVLAKKHAKQSVGDFAVGFNWGAKYIKNKTI